MEKANNRPTWLTGGLVGLLLTAPAIAIFYLGDQLAGLPFVPFDLFDWIGRILPGEVITATIDTIVTLIINLNLGETSSAAKTIEQLMALSICLVAGVLAGMLLYGVLSRQENPRPFVFGIGLGAIVGVILTLISFQVNLTATAPEALHPVWIIGVFAVWGGAFGWVYNDLSQIDTAADGAEQTSRRDFLVRLGGATATLTVIGSGLSLLVNRDTSVADSTATTAIEPDATAEAVASTADSLPNAGAEVQPVAGTRPEYTPLEDHYRIDISSRPPVINESEWALEVNGMVDEPLAFTLADLRDNYEPVEQFVTLSCISNRIAGDLISTTKWTGVPMKTLIEDWNLDMRATHLKITSADGFDEYVDLQTIRLDERVMLAYAWDDQPLQREHGFPLRIYIPDRYGMKQPKWITTIEAVEEWGEGYWVRRGWSEQAIVRTTSVVDTVAVDAAIERDGTTFIPIGGIAYSGAKGISRVEVQVDEGEWEEAQLRDPISPTTWVLWRYEWSFSAGEHTFRVRCYDGNEMMQVTERNGTRPDGATGIHSVDEEIPQQV